jgi:hypothetical protein
MMLVLASRGGHEEGLAGTKLQPEPAFSVAHAIFRRENQRQFSRSLDDRENMEKNSRFGFRRNWAQDNIG